jgi:hypothetical protein
MRQLRHQGSAGMSILPCRTEAQFCRDETARILKLVMDASDENLRKHLTDMAREWLERAILPFRSVRRLVRSQSIAPKLKYKEQRSLEPQQSEEHAHASKSSFRHVDGRFSAPKNSPSGLTQAGAFACSGYRGGAYWDAPFAIPRLWGSLYVSCILWPGVCFDTR